MIDDRYNYSKYLDSVIDGYKGDYVAWKEGQKYSSDDTVNLNLLGYFNTLRIVLLKYDILLPEGIFNTCSRDLQNMKSLIVDHIMHEPLSFLDSVVLKDFVNDKQVRDYFLTNRALEWKFKYTTSYESFDWFSTKMFREFCVGLWLEKILNEHIDNGSNLDLDIDDYTLLAECNLSLRSVLTEPIEPVYNHTEIDNVSKTLFDINLKEEN